jgi:hypothetical protein
MARPSRWPRLLIALASVLGLLVSIAETSHAEVLRNDSVLKQAEVPCLQDSNLNLKGTAPNLELSRDGIFGSTPTFIDSLPLSKSGGNPYREIGTWSTGSLSSFSAAHPECWGPGFDNGIFRPHVWLGLRNSDDQGTKFDLKAEVLLDETVLGETEVHCVEGLTRSPAKAVEVAIYPIPGLDSAIIAHGPVLPTDAELRLRISARIGTDAAGPCKGHSSSTGLRLYYDSETRPSHILWYLCHPPEPFRCLAPVRD